jgi:hypothetical protein
MPVTDTL